MSSSSPFTSIGGQAVIEGVMMRSPGYVALAVRRPDKKIIIQAYPYLSLSKKVRWFGKPVIRGVVSLIESLIQGMDALGRSTQVATQGANTDEPEEMDRWKIALSIFFALFFGLGLFVGLPHLLTLLLMKGVWGHASTSKPSFHLIDGAIKVGILLTYVYSISFLNDIYRVFQYHGAEHKSIYTFEKGEELTVANAKKYPLSHPRCGTSFLLFLVLISILVFSGFFPLLGHTRFSSNRWINHGMVVLIKFVLMFPVAGLSYEFIKLCSFRMNQRFFRFLISPGLLLQKLTTREPDDDQLEVALVALRHALRLEKGLVKPSVATSLSRAPELVVAGLQEITQVAARVEEFPEI